MDAFDIEQLIQKEKDVRKIADIILQEIEDSYNKGYRVGFYVGHNYEYEDSYEDGYDDGYKEGYEDGCRTHTI